MKTKLEPKQCPICKKLFEKKITCSKKKWKTIKCCSNSCAKTGIVPSKETRKKQSESWTPEMRRIASDTRKGICANTGRTHIKKGQRLSPKTQFKKGMTPWHKGKTGIYSKERLREMREEKLKNPTQTQFQKGDIHPNWKGGITPENSKARHNSKSRLWREEVFERDKYTCQKCKGKEGGRLHSHHIYNFANHIKLRYEIDNGITLHQECHKEFHKLFGISGNTKKQIEQFLGYKLFSK